MLLFVLASVWSVTICALPNITFLVGSCWLLISGAEDITNDLAGLNMNEKQTNLFPVAKERFRSIVNNYCELKQLLIDSILSVLMTKTMGQIPINCDIISDLLPN